MISKQERLSAEHRQPFCTVVVSIMWICLLSLGSWFLNPAMILRAGVNTEDFLIEGTTLVAYQGTAASVSIPDSVTVIGAEAFKGNQKITAVTIPEGVVRLEASAFDGCNRLTQVSIGSGLQTLGDGVFSGCDSLKEVTISPDNTKFTCEDGTLYQKEKADVNRHQTEDSLIICQVFAGREKESYRMSDRVTGIRKYAFWGCSKLNQITLSNALTEIPAYAFSNCTGLKQITIPYSVRNIQMKAFEHCKNLVQIDLPKSVREIHKTAFDGCNQLETEIPQVANEKQKPEETVSANHILGEAVIVGNHAVVLMDSAGEEVLTGNEVYQLRADRPDITADLSEDRTQVKRRVHYRDTDTRTYRIPTGVTAIGEFAFARSALTSIT
ncbi:MAG: leucine-rich repeat domain-containing protein, partial [Lachnospiraceae bacterium]